MEIDDPVEVPIPRSTFLPAHEEINPFSILNNFPGFRDPMMGPTAHDFFAQGPRVSQPRVSREIPIEVKDDNSHVQVGPSNTGPAIEEVTGNDLPPHYGPEIHPTVIVDENDDVVNVDGGNNSGRLHHVDPSPSAPIVADVTDYNNDIEEQMIQAAIEASRRDAMGHSEESFDVNAPCFQFVVVPFLAYITFSLNIYIYIFLMIRDLLVTVRLHELFLYPCRFFFFSSLSKFIFLFL